MFSFKHSKCSYAFQNKPCTDKMMCFRMFGPVTDANKGSHKCMYWLYSSSRHATIRLLHLMQLASYKFKYFIQQFLSIRKLVNLVKKGF